MKEDGGIKMPDENSYMHELIKFKGVMVTVDRKGDESLKGKLIGVDYKTLNVIVKSKGKVTVVMHRNVRNITREVYDD